MGETLLERLAAYEPSAPKLLPAVLLTLTITAANTMLLLGLYEQMAPQSAVEAARALVELGAAAYIGLFALWLASEAIVRLARWRLPARGLGPEAVE